MNTLLTMARIYRRISESYGIKLSKEEWRESLRPWRYASRNNTVMVLEETFNKILEKKVKKRIYETGDSRAYPEFKIKANWQYI